LADVPTIKEQGSMNLEFPSWFGVVAPSKAPADTSREEFSRIIAADTEAWGKAVAATGFKAD
jgi:tripartite-type tricarboxylate transporter receptor subunit TctC